jgi:alanine racemase
VRLTVDLTALRHNYRIVADRAAPARVAAVIKADAYGLGARPICAALMQAGCRDFFVAHLGEALALEPPPKDGTLYILNGLQPGEEDDCAQRSFVPVINSLEQAHRWRATAARSMRALPAVFQIDSGMTRLGLDEADLAVLAGTPGYFDAVPVRLVISHLACADEADHPANTRQRQRFVELSGLLPRAPLSLANSAGVFLGAGFTFDLVRSGLALLGVGASLKPVVQLHARVIQQRTVQPGAGVGYGLSFTTDRVMTLATVSMGYADGWPRRLGNFGRVCVDGMALPVVGRVSMDSFTVDASALPEGRLHLGDLVELIGPSQSLQTVARMAETIPYEILTGLGRRHPAVYLDA